MDSTTTWHPAVVHAALATLGCTDTHTTPAGNIAARWGAWTILIAPHTATIVVQHTQNVVAAGSDTIRTAIMEALQAEGTCVQPTAHGTLRDHA